MTEPRWTIHPDVAAPETVLQLAAQVERDGGRQRAAIVVPAGES